MGVQTVAPPTEENNIKIADLEAVKARHDEDKKASNEMSAVNSCHRDDNESANKKYVYLVMPFITFTEMGFKLSYH